jgi:chromosome segregation ATPase
MAVNPTLIPVNEAAATDNFHSLEEKVYRTIELLKHAREAKAASERDLARVREQLEAREEELEAAKADNLALRREREDVRERVEKLLGQIDAIAEAGE